MLNVGPFQHAKVMASGGIAPEQVVAWLEAGAMAVGIGTQVQPPAILLSFKPEVSRMVCAACGSRHSAADIAGQSGFHSGGGGLAGQGPSSGRLAVPKPFGISRARTGLLASCLS